jgi:acetyl esterase/lipase
VAIAGEGLGAGLAAALLLHLRDVEAPLPHSAVLISGLLDLTLDARSLELSHGDRGFDLAELRRKVGRYAGDTPLTDPMLSPLHGNLHGLPRTQILVAGTDPLLDDSLAFAARAARSGVAVDLRVSPDAATLDIDRLPAMADFLQAQTPQNAKEHHEPGQPAAR